MNNITQRAEQAVFKTVQAILAIIVVAVVFAFVLFYLSWSLYLLASAHLQPQYSALLVAGTLVLFLFMVLKLFQRSLTNQQNSDPEADNFSNDLGSLTDSTLGKLSFAMLAGFLYDKSPELRSELTRTLILMSRQD